MTWFRILVPHDNRTQVGRIFDAPDDIRSKVLVEMGYLEPVEGLASPQRLQVLKPAEPPKGGQPRGRKSKDRLAEGSAVQPQAAESVPVQDGEGHRDGGEEAGTGSQAE